MPSEPLRFAEIRNTSAFRLTGLLGATFAIGLVALLGLVYFLTVRELDARTDRILHFQARELLEAPADDLPQRITNLLKTSSSFTHLALLSADGEKVAGDIIAYHTDGPHSPRSVQSPVGPLRLMAIRTSHGEMILIARDDSAVRNLRQRLLLTLLSSGVVILVGTAYAAILLSRGPLRRVRALEAAAQEIASGKLDTRMPILGRGDELDQIAGTVNLMVDEIGRVIAQVKGVTDSVAHDLRTPLGHVRAHLLQLEKLPEAEPIAGKALAELDQVLARFQALLRISELEAGARTARFADVDLTQLATEVFELYEPVAEERGISLSLQVQPATIEGDHHLLLEALANLVGNAIKYARTAVTLSVSGGAAGAINVRDDGAGIAEEERVAVLRRFHRGANAEGRPGAGLGLSIVVAIAHLHGLELKLADAEPGLIATLREPRSM